MSQEPLTFERRAHAAALGGDRTAEWMFHELQYVRRAAQAEAELAYAAWSELAGRDRYAVYRAAQDRADAAQDQLAGYVRGSHAEGPVRLLNPRR